MRGCIVRWGIWVGLALAAFAPGTAHASDAAWQPAAASGAELAAGIAPEDPEVFRLDQAALRSALSEAPLGRAGGARSDQVAVAVPGPGGGLQRFAVRESPVMEPELAAEYPSIKTYAGRGLDDPSASIRLDLTPLGFHASVFSERGAWYVDPIDGEKDLYASYRRDDLPAGTRPPLTEPGGGVIGESAPAGRADTARRGTGVTQRIYRLALVNDPSYASEFGAGTDPEVLAAKTTLINRVNQVYNDDVAIKLILIAGTDELNLSTNAEYSGANGPCGETPCFTGTSCDPALLDESRIALGQLAGASNFDIGHLVLGSNGGGIASFGVGREVKGEGCTGVDPPVGDPFAIDYVAHEMGHQFFAQHSFNGVASSCANRVGAQSVEPGSGSSIMAYAGICAEDNLQLHSDPYFSQRSIEVITNYVNLATSDLTEVQTASLTGFDASDSFQISYGGQNSATITNGVNYTAAGIEAAIEGIPGWPAGATVVVSGYSGTGSPGSGGFSVSFEGSLADLNAGDLGIVAATGFTGFFGETVQGGPAGNGGASTVATANASPVVTAPADETIPVQTPFTLEGEGTDPDGDPLVFTWEQNDRGVGSVGTSLVSNTKLTGPLFRMFSTASDTYTNAATSDPSRTFPDMAQIAAGNTNASTGACPAGNVECFSEFLPTAAYAAAMNFRLTARDRAPEGAGVGSDDVTINVEDAAGPFRVTSQAAPATVTGGSSAAITWDVAGTDSAPVDASEVAISYSTDGGLTYPTELVATTPNDGSHTVTVPNVATTEGRFRVQAVGNVFFDISHADLTVEPEPVDTDPPETTIDSGPAEGSTTNDPTPTFAFSSNEGGSTFQCKVDSGGFASCTSPHTTSALAVGSHTFQVRATDAAGNTGAPASRTFTVEAQNEAPDTTILSGPRDVVKIKKGKRKAKVVYEYGSDEDPVTYECNINSTDWRPCFQATLYKLGKGTWTLEARAVDSEGLADPTPVSDTIKVKKKRRRR